MRRLDKAFRPPEGWQESRDICAPLRDAIAWFTASLRNTAIGFLRLADRDNIA